MDSPSEKYPALARALDKKILDGEGNELTTEAAIEMLISSEEYFPPAPNIRTSTAAELERELTRTSKPATMGSALARVRAFVGHPSNLWHGPGYKPGESPLIVLNSTYEWGTSKCMEWFLNGGVDFTFLLLIDGIISRGLCTRRQAMEKLAVVNFYDRILPNDETKPMTSDYYPSEFLFAERLRELNPKVVLLLGEHGTYSKDVVRKLFHEEREISRQHPLPMSYKTMEVLEKAWAEVQAKCAYLAVLK